MEKIDYCADWNCWLWSAIKLVNEHSENINVVNENIATYDIINKIEMIFMLLIFIWLFILIIKWIIKLIKKDTYSIKILLPLIFISIWIIGFIGTFLFWIYSIK